MDCVNVVAYEVNDVCHKLNLITSFANSGNSKQILNKCPIIVSIVLIKNCSM